MFELHMFRNEVMLIFETMTSPQDEEESLSLDKDAMTSAAKRLRLFGSKEFKTHVFVWGLNDKDQLGGPKGSKIKSPELNETLSAINCVQIVGGSKCLFCGV